MNKKNKWDLIITPSRGWFDLELNKLWKYRDLIILFIRRDLVAVHKQTILGPLYFLITPIIATLISSLIFGKIAKLSTDGIPQFLFYMSGNLFWTYFSTCVDAGKSTLSANSALYSQVYFPRLSIPISQSISALIKLIIQFIMFFIFYIYFYMNGSLISPSIYIVMIPLLLLQCFLIGLGSGLFISSFTVKYRDLNFLYTFIISLWMYISPVVYPLSKIPKEWHYLISFNPMVSIIECSRKILFNQGIVEPLFFVNGFLTTIVILVTGLLFFNKVERNFLDSI
tara:strand:- start:101 stop:949 length:849 start_codon:yes stop_codon:yes gene_type:complete